jgi:hypothetical protein
LILGRRSIGGTIFGKKAREIARPINESPWNLAFWSSPIYFSLWFWIGT